MSNSTQQITDKIRQKIETDQNAIITAIDTAHNNVINSLGKSSGDVQKKIAGAMDAYLGQVQNRLLKMRAITGLIILLSILLVLATLFLCTWKLGWIEIPERRGDYLIINTPGWDSCNLKNGQKVLCRRIN